MKFKEWLVIREDDYDWGGASFIGTGTNPMVNDPDYPNSRYQGKGIRWDEPSNMKSIKNKYKLEKKHKHKHKAIEDRVPEQGEDEKEREEKEGKINNKINYGTEEDGDGNIGSIRGESDPMATGNNELRKVEKMYKLAPTYELKR